MNIIPANQPVAFSSDQSAPGLFVGMKVFDLSTGSPVQVTGQPGQTNGVYPMTAFGGSNSYFAQFTPSPQKKYLMLYQVYTDGTYTTPSGDSQSEAVFAKILTPTFIKGLEIMVGCEIQRTQKQVVYAQNSDGSIVLTFIDEDGNSVDISSATALSVSILEADETTVLTKSLTSGISIVDGYNNKALVQFEAADFALLPSGDNTLQVTLVIDGVTTVVNLYAALDIEPAIS